MTSPNSKKPEPDWGQPIPLTPEQIILWLDGHRNLMHEIWTKNPELRQEWERLNAERKKAKPDPS